MGCGAVELSKAFIPWGSINPLGLSPEGGQDIPACQYIEQWFPWHCLVGQANISFFLYWHWHRLRYHTKRGVSPSGTNFSIPGASPWPTSAEAAARGEATNPSGGPAEKEEEEEVVLC